MGKTVKRKINSALMTAAVTAAVLAAALLADCRGPAYQDGVWSGKSGPDDTGAWGEVSVTIARGRVSGCVFVTRQKDGTVKAEDYGKINGEISNPGYYEKAQLAVRAMKRYAEQYAETGKLGAVDSISGATIAYNQFMEAAEQALAAAER
jgi:major membrane immunogen (membrane-anchored lipoprotein)